MSYLGKRNHQFTMTPTKRMCNYKTLVLQGSDGKEQDSEMCATRVRIATQLSNELAAGGMSIEEYHFYIKLLWTPVEDLGRVERRGTKRKHCEL